MANWVVGASRSLPLARRDGWDGAAARESIFKWAGWPDNPKPAQAKKGFLIYDSSADDLKGSYKLPFAMVIDGTLTAVDKGVTAASQRLSSTDAPESVLSRAQGVIEHYQKRFEASSEKTVPTELRFTFPARIHRSLAGVDLLSIAKSTRAFDPAVFDESAPFFWRSEMSNERLDTYFTRMDITSLRNYAADAQAGIGFQDSHDTHRMSLGRSLTGQLDQASGIIRVLADFFTLPDIALNGGSYANTNDFIRSVRAGIANDNSIGFYFDNVDPNQFAGFRCDICGNDLFDWGACRHIPGVTYETPKEDGSVSRAVATATVMNAHASECSAVYAGSTPGAAIIKAQYEAGAGRLKPQVARFLEQRYRSIGLKLSEAREIYALGTIEREDDEMGERTEPATKPDDRAGAEPARHPADVEFQNNLRSLMTEAGFAETVEVPTGVRNLVDEVKRLRAANAGIPELEKRAKDGDAYRTAMIDDAIKAGKRAVGEDFDEAQYRDILKDLPVASIKRMKDDWQKQGDARFPGGRETQDEETDTSKTENKRTVPASAYHS